MAVQAPPVDRVAQPLSMTRRPTAGLTPAALVLLAFFVAATGLGAGHAVVMWLLLFVLIAVHEAGHAAAANRLRLPVTEVVVGLGPVLARVESSSVRVEVRLLPIVGWVEADIPVRAPRIHRRRMAFAAAGAAASLGFAMALVLVAYGMARGPSSISGGDVVGAGTLTVEVAVETPALLVGSVIGIATSTHDDEEPGPGGGPPQSSESSESAETVTIIGATAAMSNDLDDLGRIALPLWAASLSAAIAGFNLIPAFGLDGEMILAAAADGVRARHRRAGRALRAVVALVGLLLGVVLAVGVVRALVDDLVTLA